MPVGIHHWSWIGLCLGVSVYWLGLGLGQLRQDILRYQQPREAANEHQRLQRRHRWHWALCTADGCAGCSRGGLHAWRRGGLRLVVVAMRSRLPDSQQQQ